MPYTTTQYEYLSKSSDCRRNGTAEVQMVPQSRVHLFKTEKSPKYFWNSIVQFSVAEMHQHFRRASCFHLTDVIWRSQRASSPLSKPQTRTHEVTHFVICSNSFLSKRVKYANKQYLSGRLQPRHYTDPPNTAGREVADTKRRSVKQTVRCTHISSNTTMF